MGRPWPEAGEPLFTPEDREAALEWMYEQSLKCPGCGNPRDESMDREAQSGVYEAHVLRCHACAERERKAKEFTHGGNYDPAGLFYTIRKARDE